MLGRVSTPSRSRGRPPVPVDRMIATAIAILDEQGAEALSMRTLAQRLESGTATLYRHFASRDDLIARVVDTVMGEVDVDTEELGDLPWQQACETLAHAMFDVLRRHPNVAPLMTDSVPVGPQMLTLRERALAHLLDSGFAPPLALRAWATLARYVLGFGAQITAADAEAPAGWAAVDISDLPATMAVAEHFPISLDTEFAFGLELLISGLERQLPGKRRTGA
ncbi:TetR/AcrR family transcriptional regulator [Mycolicibacterium moriokaense]|nr:TetR/AcrR family transcriptional regulator [Mycolicibacterium moriokaense]